MGIYRVLETVVCMLERKDETAFSAWSDPPWENTRGLQATCS